VDEQPGPAAFDRADPEELGPMLATCLRADEWVGRMLLGRPYRSLPALEAAATTAAEMLSDQGLDQALAAHPRIGERPEGDSTEAAHSRREQAGVATDTLTAERLRRANVAYEARFGHVFLVRAAGRTAEEMLQIAQDRLGNDADTERDVVRQQLGEIAVLRLHDVLDRLVSGAPTQPTAVQGPA
jgi:2-oxo-4-hydroxy-4-carboxy-5-ureidoimidazoline decarboxylase